MATSTGLGIALTWLKACDRLRLAGYTTVPTGEGMVRILDGERPVWDCSTVNELHAAAAIAEYERYKAAKSAEQ